MQSMISGEAILDHPDKLNPMTSGPNKSRGHRQKQRQELHSHKLVRTGPGDASSCASSSDPEAERRGLQSLPGLSSEFKTGLVPCLMKNERRASLA